MASLPVIHHRVPKGRRITMSIRGCRQTRKGVGNRTGRGQWSIKRGTGRVDPGWELEIPYRSRRRYSALFSSGSSMMGAPELPCSVRLPDGDEADDGG